MSPRKLGEDTSTEEVAEATEETVADTETTATEEPAAEETPADVEPEPEPSEPDTGIKEDPTEAAKIYRDESTTRVLAPGTVLSLGSEKVTLVEAVQVAYDQARNESHFAALCRMSGNYDANKHLLSVAYDQHGIPIEPDPE